MSFFERITGRDRSGDSKRQVKSGANDFHDDWGVGTYTPPSDEQRAKWAAEDASKKKEAAASKTLEETRGVPASFAPHLSRIAPEGTSQAFHDHSLVSAHQRFQTSQYNVHVDGNPKGAYDLSNSSGPHYEMWERSASDQSQAPRHAATIRNPKIISVPNRDGLGSTPHLEYSLAAGGSSGRHTKPLSEVHGLETSRSENQPQRQSVSDGSNEWYRN
jgi:hypothetical protein